MQLTGIFKHQPRQLDTDFTASLCGLIKHAIAHQYEVKEDLKSCHTEEEALKCLNIPLTFPQSVCVMIVIHHTQQKMVYYHTTNTTKQLLACLCKWSNFKYSANYAVIRNYGSEPKETQDLTNTEEELVFCFLDSIRKLMKPIPPHIKTEINHVVMFEKNDIL